MEIQLMRNDTELFINYRLDDNSNFKLYGILNIEDIKRID